MHGGVSGEVPDLAPRRVDGRSEQDGVICRSASAETRPIGIPPLSTRVVRGIGDGPGQDAWMQALTTWLSSSGPFVVGGSPARKVRISSASGTARAV